MYKFLNLCLFLFITVCLKAQLDYSKMEWGEVAAVDLAMTVYESDTAAQAVVLADQGIMTVGRSDNGQYEYVLRHHKRIKILTEAALEEYGDVSLIYAHKNDRDYLSGVNAQVLTPDGKVIKLNKADFSREKLDDTWSQLTFSFPGAPVGSILEYRYHYASNSVLSPRPWSFRGELPVRSSYFAFKCLVPLEYTYVLYGTTFMQAVPDANGQNVLKMGATEILIDAKSFWLQNGEAVTEEPFMTALKDYHIYVRFQARASFDAYGNRSSIYGTWEETSKELLNNDHLGYNFTRKRKYNKLLKAAKATIDRTAPQEDVLFAINRFITKEISWSGDYGIWTKQTPDEAFAKHQGSVAEIQYAGVALLREYGIKAYPILLSTRSNGAMITAFPFLRQFDYVITIVEIDDVARLVDFTDPYLRPGFVRVEALNGKGFMLDKENPVWMNLGGATVRDMYVWEGKITQEGHLQGHMKASMYTISGRNDRVRQEEESLTEIWSARLPSGTVLRELEAEHQDDVREPLIVTGEFELPDAGFVNDDFLYVTPVLFTNLSDNPFKSEKRTYPVNFPYPFEEKSIYQYELPIGYTVESLPEETTVFLPNSDAQFQYLAQEKSGRISILIILKINKTIFLPAEYDALRELFEVAAQKVEEQIVLRKME